LADLDWRVRGGNDFDSTFDIGFPVLWRNYDRLDHEVATEHTVMSSSEEVFKEAVKRNLTAKDANDKAWNAYFVSWKFADDSPTKEAPVASVKFSFWESMANYDVEWKYDSANNSYLRFNGDQPHTDLEEQNKQISAKNVVVMYVSEKDTVDKEGHTFIKTVGQGKSVVFQNGQALEGTWTKSDEKARTKFFDKNGKEISFVRGTIWIEAVPDYSQATY
jgi:hypothetical protein